jgi:cytosine/adenosine deaminase-related metal-dependent hydrolase
MVTYISADRIYPVNQAPIKNGVIGVDENGLIHAILTPAAAEAGKIDHVKHYKGVLVPGFINTHCHLELSHLRNQLEEKTGLTNFIKGVLSFREKPEAQLIEAMELADQEMYENGIVAVGDIANLLISKKVKLKSKIYYHTFVEVFGFNAPAEQTYAKGVELKAGFKPLKASIVPHAPYSVSAGLFKEIEKNTMPDDLISIHNQETLGENEIFLTGTGKIADFFATLGIAQSDDHNTGKNSLEYHLPKLPKQLHTLLVHNTFTTEKDLSFAKTLHSKLYWCLCPNANLYIENSLPNVKLFKDAAVKITLGTDSLASNHQLNILNEMEILQRHQHISFEESLKWATLNGAEFLGIDSQYGSLAEGKKPGIVLINLNENGELDLNTKIKRLF